MTTDELIDDIAAVLAGLQVPVSMNMPLGAAQAPWRRLFDELHGFGWTNKEEIAGVLRTRLFDRHEEKRTTCLECGATLNDELKCSVFPRVHLRAAWLR